MTIIIGHGFNEVGDSTIFNLSTLALRTITIDSKTSNTSLKGVFVPLSTAITSIIQLFDKGVVEYHFYSDEINSIRRGEAELF